MLGGCLNAKQMCICVNADNADERKQARQFQPNLFGLMISVETTAVVD